MSPEPRTDDEGTHASKSGDRRPTDLRRIGASVAVCLAVVHAAQVVAGDQPMVAVVAFGLCAAWMVGWRKDVLRSVRTAVFLLVTLSLACVAATLTVQRSQLEHASDEEFEGTVAFAWAHLLVKLSHPWPRSAALQPEQEARLGLLAEVFGEDMVEEQREKLEGSLMARADEERARGIADDHPELFAAGHRAARGLMLTDLFRAWWFIALFYLLCLNLGMGAVVRRKVALRNLGFHGSHLGLILVVGGATVGGFLGERGFVALTVGEPANQFQADGGRGAAPLGFSVRLDHFETLYHQDLVIEAGGTAGGDPHHGMMGRQGEEALRHTEKVEVGKVLELRSPGDETTYRVTMSEVTGALGLEQVHRPAVDGEEGEPAAKIAIGTGEAFWLGGRDSLYIDAANRFKIRASSAHAEDSSAGDTCGDGEGLGTFSVGLGDEEPLSIPASPGRALSVGGLQVTVLEVYPDFSVGGGPPSADDFPRNPALRVRMSQGDDPPGTYLFFAAEELRSFTELPWAHVTAAFEFDYWCSPTGAWIDLRIGDGGTTTAWIDRREEVPESLAATADTPIPIPGSEEIVTVLDALPSAVQEVRPVLVEGEPASDDAPSITALRLTVDGGEGAEDHWLLANTMAGSLTLPAREGGGLRLRFEDNTGRPPRDWKSSLSVLEEGNEVAGGVVQVNEPFCYGGYCFFQSDANPDRPDYSGLQVVRDPSWSLVKAGLWMLLLGISWVFYVQPLFDRRRRAPVGAAAGGDG